MSNAELCVIMNAAKELWDAIEDFENNQSYESVDERLDLARKSGRYKAQFQLFDDIVEQISGNDG